MENWLYPSSAVRGFEADFFETYFIDCNKTAWLERKGVVTLIARPLMRNLPLTVTYIPAPSDLPKEGDSNPAPE